MSNVENFKCDKLGENSSAKAETESGMGPRESMAINGVEDLSNAIKFNDDGKVYHIKLESSPGNYDYVLQVDARGPSGAFSGSGHLKFTDVSGDTYSLSIYSSTRSIHTVRYNSKNPAIIKVEWSN